MSAPPAIVKVSERDFQRAVIEFAQTLGWTVAHFSDSRRQIAPGRFIGDTGAAGFPDLVLARERVVYAELKTETGRVSKNQLRWLGVLETADQETYVWRPSMWSFITDVLRRRG